jgi:hypothetical protein
MNSVLVDVFMLLPPLDQITGTLTRVWILVYSTAIIVSFAALYILFLNENHLNVSLYLSTSAVRHAIFTRKSAERVSVAINRGCITHPFCPGTKGKTLLAE